MHLKKKISAIIITLNEEKKIGQCLDSLKDIADELVVVDSYSSDKTKEISVERGARFVEHSFKNYIEQKNFALSCAQNDYVLSLDADEVISDRLKVSLLAVKDDLRYSGYTMNRLTFFEEKGIKHSGWYPDVKLRLFDRRKGGWEGLSVHEKFRFTYDEPTKHLKGDLLHYSFDSEDDLICQTENFARLGAEAYFQNGKKAPLWKVKLNPVFRFVRDYFLRGGLWHGAIGLKISCYNAKGTKLKYSILRDLYKTKH